MSQISGRFTWGEEFRDCQCAYGTPPVSTHSWGASHVFAEGVHVGEQD